MWQLSNINLPTVKNNSTSIGSSFKLIPNTNLTNLGKLCVLFDDNTIQTVASVTPGLEPNTYTTYVETNPVTVTSNNITYIPAINPTNPQIGEFIYNDKTLTIYSNKTINNISYISQISNLKSLRVFDVPSILYDLPIEGGFVISESFQDHPTCNLIFITTQSNLPRYRNRFAINNLLNLYNYSFIVNNYNEEIYIDTNQVKVSVGLRGKWDSYVNTPISISPTTNDVVNNDNKFQDPDCQVNNNVDEDNSNKINYISIQGLAAKIGANISGITFNIKESDSVSDNLTTTISTELNKYLDIKGCFIDYNDASSIVCKKLNNVGFFVFYEEDLLSTFSTSITRRPVTSPRNIYGSLNDRDINLNALVPSTITSPPIKGLSSEDTSLIAEPTIANYVVSDNFKPQVNKKKIKDIYPFKAVPKTKRTYVKGDKDPTFCPNGIRIIEDLSLNFDQSGVTKTRITVTEENGDIISEVVERFGFAYTAWDITQMRTDPGSNVEYPIMLSTNPDQFWFLIEKKVTNYIYDDFGDSGTGYFLGYNITGERLLRVKTEGSDLYTQVYNLASSNEIDNYDTAVYNTYLFRYVPIYGGKRYSLVTHAAYYKNFEAEEKYVKKCNRDGTSSYIKNPNYVQPMFAIAESEELQCYLQKGDPRNLLRDRDSTEPYYAPLVSGEETYNRVIININASENTTLKVGYGNALSSSGLIGTPDTYSTYTSNFSAQEPGFGTIVENTNTTDNNGIPPVHTRRKPKYEIVQPDKEEDEKLPNSEFRYILFTSPYRGGYPRLGSYDFEKATMFNEVLTGVETQLKIDDIRNTLQSTVTVKLDLSIKVGDICIFKVGGIEYKRRVLSLSHQFILNGIDINGVPLMTNGGTNLTLGLERPITNIQYKKEKIPNTINTNNNNNKPSDGYILQNDFSLGSILNIPSRTRGKYARN